MAGSAPPDDAPSLADQTKVELDAGFQAGPPAASLCKFKLPLFLFKLAIKLPPLNFPPPFPTFSFSLGLSCDLSNPINVTAGVKFGGGRKATGQTYPD
jgi:hypothetical protein